MNFVIRVDASLQMGTGHVMRCLTLAEVIKQRGGCVTFISRTHQGHLVERIRSQGFRCHELPIPMMNDVISGDLYHSAWLGGSQQQDAQMCEPILADIRSDWLIVDHYAIDYRWHNTLKPYYDQLMVIDDLADRNLSADLMLNQNYGANELAYDSLVGQACKLLLGLDFALLRREFNHFRPQSLERRSAISTHRKLLINMGGVDEKNITSAVLAIFSDLSLLPNWEVLVVVGEKYPHIEMLRSQIEHISLHRSVSLLVGVTNMAEIMTSSDLAIGAAGATTWERCCLGLPTIQLVIAYNQEAVAQKLADDGVVLMAKSINDIEPIIRRIDGEKLHNLSQKSATLCDGFGVDRVVSMLFNDEVSRNDN